MKDEAIRCCACGKFIGVNNFDHADFTPDSEYTIEKAEYICKSCKAKEIKK